ncbi:transglutaminase-like domain-containing protein [Maribacter polysaccharolyticus]|uniref:transglutaminase-like domain-containing protein n=1 Tax=Maribacter polysaccharolyticus TaxID=3020831 RepID=UPI00237F136F|nr:transglutaminase family protein [Maribacter polysaccharolyticus]MDE3743372.1 transglutaminase family protein [Maribacter polysaccharolyticus]
MSQEYEITYKAKNDYESPVNNAHWQFLIIPEQNLTQELISVDFTNSINAYNEYSVNGQGFNTIRVQPKTAFENIVFTGSFKVRKHVVNPFDQLNDMSPVAEYDLIKTLDFKVDHEPFLRFTPLTTLPVDHEPSYVFNFGKSIFENLQELNTWIFDSFEYVPAVTNVKTTLKEIIALKQGVCQDFAHLFCALCRRNSIPARYVSGYLHQGNGYIGDTQMHAWAEAFIPTMGWVGFDPTNNILASGDHIKVAHGKDYSDCPPLRGVVYSMGKNETTHSVEVLSQQQ